LNKLVNLSEPLQSKSLAMLSGPSREDAKAFALAWAVLPDERREEAMQCLVDLAEGRFDIDFNALFRVSLADPSALVRRLAIEGLWEDEAWDLAVLLMRVLLTDESINVRAAAATSLGRYVYLGECDDLAPTRAQQIRTVLDQVVADPEEAPEVVRRAVESLAFINDESTVQMIRTLYKLSDESMRVSALFSMGRNADDCWVNIVCDELNNAAPAIRYEASRACGEMQLSRAVPRLAELADDADAEVSQMAIWALGQVGNKQAETALRALLEHDNEAISTAAAEALDSLESGIPFDMMIHVPSKDSDLVEVTSDDDDDLDEFDEFDDAEDIDDAESWDDDPLELD